jgi:hypothetical protein
VEELPACSSCLSSCGVLWQASNEMDRKEARAKRFLDGSGRQKEHRYIRYIMPITGRLVKYDNNKLTNKNSREWKTATHFDLKKECRPAHRRHTPSQLPNEHTGTRPKQNQSRAKANARCIPSARPKNAKKHKMMGISPDERHPSAIIPSVYAVSCNPDQPEPCRCTVFLCSPCY